MIDQLITALSKEVEMSAEEIADTIWLALQMQEFQAESVSSGFPLNKEDERGINKQESQSEQGTLPKTSELGETPTSSPEERKAGIYPRNQQHTSKSLDLSFKVPDARSLREPLTLARALKPLMRRIPSGRELVLDEAATIQRIADEGLWIPVLRPTVEPWLDLELVVDEAISMQIWRHTIRELERLLKNYGIFRDVRVWGLITDENEQVQIRRGIGATARSQTPRSPKELIDPSGRRLVLLVSDCVSSLWRNGAVTPVLELWAKQGSMAIVQMLPKWLWKRTALGRASEVRLRGLEPGVSNQKLVAKEVSLWDELEEERGVKVPVFTLEADKVVTWAQMVSGKGSVWTLGYVFKLDTTPVQKESGLFNLAHGDLSAEQRIQAFRVTASPMARKLAGLLASAPVISLPIFRLIRETLLDKSQQVHVAEVFLGGLLKPLSEINADTNPDYIQYDFIEGVRELLVDSVPSKYVLNVVDEVSKYVAKKAGLSLEDFAAVLRNPQQVRDSEIVEEFGYFATVTAQVLRRLGGEYSRFADELEFAQKLEQSRIFKIPIRNAQVYAQIYYHQKDFTLENANFLKKTLENQGIPSLVLKHRNPNPPDAIFIGALVSAEKARIAISAISYQINYIFPLEYPEIEGGDTSGFLIGIGYISNHNWENRTKNSTPKKIGKRELDYLTEIGISDQEFQRRLQILTSKPIVSDQPALQRLEQMIGLRSVKDIIHRRMRILEVQRERVLQGLVTEPPRLHLVFKGNPGTGKTTVARLIGEIYRDLGLLQQGHVVEVGCQDLVAGYVGQTAMKTDSVIDIALDGVIFIDEAYNLNQGENDNFGLEAINTLLYRMEDDKHRLAVIIAGYPDKINEFINSNPGLKRRLPTEVLFEDYQPEELMAIFRLRVSQVQGVIAPQLETALINLFTRLYEERDAQFGNARLVENLFIKMDERRSLRILQQNLDISQEPFQLEDLPPKEREISNYLITQTYSMTHYEHLKQILHRLEKGQQTDEDITVLRELLLADDRQFVQQLGKYNVNIGEGKEI